MTDEQLRQRLVEAVPELPAPPDRLAAVGARVRRQRALVAGLTAGATAVAVGLALGVPRMLASAEPPAHQPATSRSAPSGPAPGGPVIEPRPVVFGPDGCPERKYDLPQSTVDDPGPLVPTGAADIVLCEAVVDPASIGGERTSGQSRTLTTGVADLVHLLNGLPDQAAMLAELSRREIAAGRPAPSTDNLLCTLVKYGAEYSFVLHYPDGSRVAVVMDRNCGTARSGRHLRYTMPSPVDEFLRRYRDQLAATTDPATIATPRCADRITPKQLDQSRLPSGPQDGISRNRGSDDPILPSPLVAVAFCRYAVGPSGATLVRHQETRQPSGWAQIVNTQFALDTQRAPIAAMRSCADPGQPLPDRMDTLVVVDATGAGSEFWIYRGPACTAVLRAGYGGLAPTAELIGGLDAMLG